VEARPRVPVGRARRVGSPTLDCTGIDVMAEQVGPANGKPTTMVALEADVNDWLPLARIPSWPGAERPNRTRPKIRLQSDSRFGVAFDERKAGGSY